MSAPPVHWVAANQRLLSAAVATVRARLQRGEGAADALVEAMAAEAAARSAMPTPSALEAVVAAFGLTPFEREVLLLATGPELSSDFALEPGFVPTFGLALGALTEPHWDALSPDGPLRRWHLLELGAGPVAMAPLRVDERVLHHLTGTGGLDPRLQPLLVHVPPQPQLAPSHLAVAAQAARLWSAPEAPLVLLTGVDAASRRAVAAEAARHLGVTLLALNAADLPDAPTERQHLARLWERETALGRLLLLVELEDLGTPGEAARARAFLDALRAPAALSSPDGVATGHRPAARLELARPTTQEQIHQWRLALGADAAALEGQIQQVVAHFNLDPPKIAAAVRTLRADPQPDAAALWRVARAAARPELHGLGQRIASHARWEDIVLPEPAQALLEDMVRHARQRLRVGEDWGFAARSDRGLGLSALFVGPSGTGKTMAAEVLANALSVDLYRVDLSSVMNKYIGETEKNLRRIFDEADGSGAILLFDEADALFGRRGEVRDSHDRYANLEVGYLLQRIETYAGLAILTTNLKANIDTAFLRRIRFVVQFPFPGREQRVEIWRRTLPPQTPTAGVDVRRLAQLNIAGGNIRNIALNAAVLAADEGEPLQMRHLLRATRAEFAKLEQPLGPAEIGGWA